MTRLPSFDNAGHVLDILVSFHRRLAELYGEMHEVATNPYTLLLLEHMQRREQRLTQALQDYEDNASDKIIKTWLQMSCPDDPNSFLTSLEATMLSDTPANATPDDVYALGSKADIYVADLLSYLQDRCERPEVKAVFADLLAGEKIEHIALSKAYNSLREM